MFNKKILIVEDEENIADLIEFNVKKNGYRCEKVDSAEKALELLNSQNFDLILLDLMLTGMDGLDFCRIFREKNKVTPIIMITARSEDADIVSGLEFGANDYITKPFSPRVLMARIKVQLREESEDDNDDDILSYNGIELNSKSYDVKIDKKRIIITANEFKILKLFLKNIGRVFSRDNIINAVHGDGYPVTDRAVDVSIVNLRKKLGSKSSIIETVRGVGYKMK